MSPIPKDAEVTVINAKAVPSTLSVEGIQYRAVMPSAAKGAAEKTGGVR